MTIHLDYLSLFTLKGQIAADPNYPSINDAMIYFVDKDLDQKRSKLKPSYKIKIGKPDDGKIEINFEYFWGFTKRFFTKKPTGDFQIQFIGKHNLEKTIDYNLFKLKKENNRYIIDMGTVNLV